MDYKCKLRNITAEKKCDNYLDVALGDPLTSQYLLQIILSTMKVSHHKSLAVFTRIVSETP